MFSVRRFIPVVTATLFALAITAHAEDRLTCESFNNRRTYCDVPRAYDSDIRMLRRLSDSPCNEGFSWGHDDRGIWVDSGCRAEFSVRKGYSKGDGYNHPDHNSYDNGNSGYNHERNELDRERERLEAERAQLEREKAAAAQPKVAPLTCPPGTHPSTHRCTKAERKQGCKDYGANDGTGRGCSNF